MLQLPTIATTARHFTKAEIADITRNAKAVKARPLRPAPIHKRIAAFKDAVRRCNDAKTAFVDVKAKLVEIDGLNPVVWVDASEARAFTAMHAGFYSIKQIEKQARCRRLANRQVIAHETAALKNSNPDSLVLREERLQIIAKCRLELKELPAIVARIKRDFRKQEVRVSGLHRRHHYMTLARRLDEACLRKWRCYETAIESNIDAPEAALALMDFCTYIVETSAVWNGDVPKMLARARKVLAKG